MYTTAPTPLSTFPIGRPARAGSRGNGDKDSASEESWNNYNASRSEAGLSFRETEQILHYYYQSSAAASVDDAGSSNDDSTTALQGHQMSTSFAQNLNRRSVDSSFSSSSGTVSAPIQRSGSARAATTISTNSAEKRRAALIEMETQSKPQNIAHNSMFTTTLSTRRGIHDARLPSLAIRGHSDVTHSQEPPLSYDAVPLSAPPIHNVFSVSDHSNGHHQRSMSDAQGKHKRSKFSRDIGIVGTIGTSLANMPLDSSSSTSESFDLNNSAKLTLPLFQTPRSRSASPASPVLVTPIATKRCSYENQAYNDKMTDSVSEVEETPTKLTASHSKHNSTDTPRNSIERERDKQRNSARLAFKPTQTPPISYLYYQPTLHATAGPLPSPPRRIHTFTASNPPPRPPRLTPSQSRPASSTPSQSRPASSERRTPSITASPEAISSQLLSTTRPEGGSDYSLTAISVTSESEQTPQKELDRSDDERRISPSENEASSDAADESFYTSNHNREGAFEMSAANFSTSLPKIKSKEILNDKHVESNADTSSVSSYNRSNQSPIPDLLIQSEKNGNSTSPSPLALDPQATPSSPSSYETSSDSQFKPSPLPIFLERRASKRTSLPPPPLTPESIFDTFYQPHPTSYLAVDLSNKLPSYHTPKRDTRKSPSAWPDAMNFKDIVSLKSPKERASAYTARFRELVYEETGLSEWVNSVVKKDRNDSSAPVNRLPHSQIRHVSRGSIASEATFPIRRDAYTATDLMSRPVADIPSSINTPPSLPYPSLAHGIGVRKRSSKNFSVESPLVSPTGSTRSLGGGFFASIGRKASLRRERTLPPVSPNKPPVSLLQVPKNNSQPSPRAIKLEHAPTLPGGPRAPPRSAHRSSTVIYKTHEVPYFKRDSVSPARRSAESNRSFDRQLDLMADLLPQVDKTILSIYLRRAKNNDSMAAISDYLEDEKRGDIRIP